MRGFAPPPLLAGGKTMAVSELVTLTTPWDNVIRLVEWNSLNNSDSGAPLNLPQFADRSIQVAGTFGSGGTLIMEGSNRLETESPVYAPLVDPQGNAISFTSAGIEQILESSYLIRPRVTAGDGTTNLTVRLLVRR